MCVCACFFVVFWEANAQRPCKSSAEAEHFKYMKNMMSLPAHSGVQAVAHTLSRCGSEGHGG